MSLFAEEALFSFIQASQSTFVDLATPDYVEEFYLNLAVENRISWFVRSHTPCTPFALSVVELTSTQKSLDPLSSNQTQVTVSRSGDYLLHTWANVTLPGIKANITDHPNTVAKWIPNLGQHLFSSIKCSFNDMLLTTDITPAIMDCYGALFVPPGKRELYDTMIGNITELTDTAYGQGNDVYSPAATLNIPIPFFWSTDTGNSLPTAALPYNEIELISKQLLSTTSLWSQAREVWMTKLMPSLSRQLVTLLSSTPTIISSR